MKQNLIKITHRTDKHQASLSASLRAMLVALRQPVYISVRFNQFSTYNLPSREQGDFNKITGRGSLAYRCKTKGNKRAGHKAEQLLAWRYIPKTDSFELAKYWRRNYQFGFMVAECLPAYQWSSWLLLSTNSLLPMPPWFGGTLPAPKQVSYEIKYTPYEKCTH